ncbi:MAG TPA: hypothetical protein ENI11_03525 [Actinobacteria bacterium]|nr:hypothetical protein [Actinomycetota bacterium]
MKRLVVILAFAIMLVSGCSQGPTNDSSANASPGYSGSAPEKMLESPEKARDAAGAASEKVQGAMDAIKEID